MNFEEVGKRWESFEALPFPDGHRTKEIVPGMNCTLLQSETAGYIMTFLQTGGSLGSRQRIALEGCCEKLSTAQGVLEDDSAREYFSELQVIAQGVLKAAHDQPVI